MAISVVQATKLTGAGATASGPVAATAGNALIAGGAGYQGTTWSVTRTGDTYTTDTNGATSGGVDLVRIGIASAPNVAGGSVTLTATSTGAIGAVAFALEVSGLPTSAIRDATSPAILTGNSTAADTNNLTNATADAIFVGVNGVETVINPATETPGTGWTATVGATTMTETNGASFPVCGQEYKIVAATGAQHAPWTLTSGPWGGIIAVYKAAAGATPKSDPIRGFMTGQVPRISARRRLV